MISFVKNNVDLPACGRRSHAGFTMIELIMSMVLTVIILGIGVTVFSSALKTRAYQSARTDAIVSAQAAINIMSREIGNSGYGLLTNGIVLADSNSSRLHIRANIDNTHYDATTDPNEDLTFYCDNCSSSGGSIVRYDPNGSGTSGVINRVSQVQFQYWDYDQITQAVSGPFTAPTLNTGRITITLTVVINNIGDAPTGSAGNITVTSDVTLRDSPYMLNRY